jgi:hypothetical protein
MFGSFNNFCITECTVEIVTRLQGRFLPFQFGSIEVVSFSLVVFVSLCVALPNL